MAAREAAPPPAPPPALPPPPPPFVWAERGRAIEELLAQPRGRADNVKLTLIGRPGKIVEQGGFVMTTMQANGKVPTLPKGLPAPPESRLLYLVYIASKQWKKVSEAIQNPDDILILEGFLTWDSELKKLSVFAQSVTTRDLQRAQRQPPAPGVGYGARSLAPWPPPPPPRTLPAPAAP